MLLSNLSWNPEPIQLLLLVEGMRGLCSCFNRTDCHLLFISFPFVQKHEHTSPGACDCPLARGEDPAQVSESKE